MEHHLLASGDWAVSSEERPLGPRLAKGLKGFGELLKGHIFQSDYDGAGKGRMSQGAEAKVVVGSSLGECSSEQHPPDRGTRPVLCGL